MQPGTSGMGRTPVPRACFAGAGSGMTGGTTAPDIIYIKTSIYASCFVPEKGVAERLFTHKR